VAYQEENKFFRKNLCLWGKNTKKADKETTGKKSKLAKAAKLLT
jgi:hypothetical protein